MDLAAYEIYLQGFFDGFDEKETPYLDGRFRKWRFNAFTNRQKSEARFMKRFKEKFGGPEEFTVFLGDWSATHTLRGQVYTSLLMVSGALKNSRIPENVCDTWIPAFAGG
jgi:hypothetical protein